MLRNGVQLGGRIKKNLVYFFYIILVCQKWWSWLLFTGMYNESFLSVVSSVNIPICELMAVTGSIRPETNCHAVF